MAKNQILLKILQYRQAHPNINLKLFLMTIEKLKEDSLCRYPDKYIFYYVENPI